MTFIVGENCIKCKYTDCVEVCPVDCFYEGPNFLVINPDECIDCTLCEPECPVEAIYSEDELPAGQEQFIQINEELSQEWPVITEMKDPPEDADEWREVKDKLGAWLQGMVPHRAGDFAQAMMDLGATVCAPRTALCTACPLKRGCAALALGAPLEFPVKPNTKPRPNKHGHTFVMRRPDGAVLLRKRPDKGVLAQMAETPGSDWSLDGGKPQFPIVGAWSMVDVFLVGLLSGLVSLNLLANIEPGVGATFFGAVVVITMFAAHSFDLPVKLGLDANILLLALNSGLISAEVADWFDVETH